MPLTARIAHLKAVTTRVETGFIRIHCQEASINPNHVASQNQQTSSAHHTLSMNQTLHRLISRDSAMNTENWGFLVQLFSTPVVTEVSQVATTSVCFPTGLEVPVPPDSFRVSLGPVRSLLQCASDALASLGTFNRRQVLQWCYSDQSRCKGHRS